MEDGTACVPITPEILAFNPGLDPKGLQPGDMIYIPSLDERKLHRKLGERIWIAEAARELELDLNNDGEPERLRTYLLRRHPEARRFAAGWEGLPFLSIFQRRGDGGWRRLRTFTWGGGAGQVQSVTLHRLSEDLGLLHVRLASFGPTSMGTQSFLSVPRNLRRIAKLRFVGGFLNGGSSFTELGSAGYGLHAKLSEDKRTFLFRKYGTLPITVLTEAEYRLEYQDWSRSYAFVLVKEERIPLSKMRQW